MISQICTCLFLGLATLAAQAQEPITVLERREIVLEPVPASPRYDLRPTLAYIAGTGWTPEAIVTAAKESARILGQCGVALETAELARIAAPIRFHDFFTPLSRELAAALKLGKPTVYFVTGTRQRPAFDAEAIGRGNSGTRPELKDTVWVTLGTRDLGIALAHELAHVLMDTGEHSDEPGNLMREDTGPENTKLTDAQCVRMRTTGLANHLVH
jgi:hypothetical protein